MNQVIPDDASTIAENLSLYDGECNRITGLFGELTTSESANFSRFKDMPISDALKERTRHLKSRYDAAVKLATQKREQNSKRQALWKDVYSRTSSLNCFLEEIEKKLDSATKGLSEVGGASGDGDLKEVAQAFVRTATRSHRVCEVSSIIPI